MWRDLLPVAFFFILFHFFFKQRVTELINKHHQEFAYATGFSLHASTLYYLSFVLTLIPPRREGHSSDYMVDYRID